MALASHQLDWIWAEEALGGVINVANHACVKPDLLEGSKAARTFAQTTLPGNPTKAEILAIQYIS